LPSYKAIVVLKISHSIESDADDVQKFTEKVAKFFSEGYGHPEVNDVSWQPSHVSVEFDSIAEGSINQVTNVNVG